jgi:hypothetical protein
MLVPTPVHPMPSFEYAMLFMPDPTATHRVPAALHATLCPYKEKMFKLDDKEMNKIVKSAKTSEHTIYFAGTGEVNGVSGDYKATLTKV